VRFDVAAAAASSAFHSATAAPAMSSESAVIKQGWLRKLARFGRDMKRCVLRSTSHLITVMRGARSLHLHRDIVFFPPLSRSYFVIAPLDTSSMMPTLTRIANAPIVVFYYTEQPIDLSRTQPHGIITMDNTTTVEAFSAGKKELFCIRMVNAHQKLRRTTKQT
jgi:hypothetical protein